MLDSRLNLNKEQDPESIWYHSCLSGIPEGQTNSTSVNSYLYNCQNWFTFVSFMTFSSFMKNGLHMHFMHPVFFGRVMSVNLIFSNNIRTSLKSVIYTELYKQWCTECSGLLFFFVGNGYLLCISYVHHETFRGGPNILRIL